MGNHGGVVHVPDSAWSDFRRRRAVDISTFYKCQAICIEYLEFAVKKRKYFRKNSFV